MDDASFFDDDGWLAIALLLTSILLAVAAGIMRRAGWSRTGRAGGAREEATEGADGHEGAVDRAADDTADGADAEGQGDADDDRIGQPADAQGVGDGTGQEHSEVEAGQGEAPESSDPDARLR